MEEQKSPIFALPFHSNRATSDFPLYRDDDFFYNERDQE
jgi:hypothetical protein